MRDNQGRAEQYYIGPDGQEYLWKFPSERCTQVYEGVRFRLTFTDASGSVYEHLGDLIPMSAEEWKRKGENRAGHSTTGGGR